MCGFCQERWGCTLTGCGVSPVVPGHALLSPSLSWLGWDLGSPDEKSVPSGLVSVSYQGDQWAFFFIFHFEVLLFPVGTWDVCRSTVNRSLWNLYIPPNSPTSLKFFFFHPSCRPKFYLCPSIALSEREKLPLASPSPCFNDNPTAQGTMSHRISTTNLQVALQNAHGFHILIFITMDFFKFILCLDQIEIVCVVSGPCWCSIFESLRVQMLWETWDSFHPLGEKLPHSLSRLWWPKLQLFIMRSLKGGRRKGGWMRGREMERPQRREGYNISDMQRFVLQHRLREKTVLSMWRNYQKRLFKNLLFPAYHTGLPCLDFICLFFKELV